MKLLNFALHQIHKEANKPPTTTIHKVRAKPDALAGKLVEVSLKAFQRSEDKPTTIYCEFNEDVANNPFSEWCIQLKGKKLGFEQFSVDCTNRLKQEMEAVTFATGGYVIFVRFEDPEDRLLVMMIHPQDGFSVGADGRIMNVRHLEMSQIDKMAVVKLPKRGGWGERPLSYAGFRKAMSIYFQKFLGPDQLRNAAQDCRGLIAEIENYVKDHEPGDPSEIRRRVREYVDKQAVANEDIDLAVVSGLVHPHQPDAFGAYAGQKGVSAFIRPDPAVFKKWRIMKHRSTDGLSLQWSAGQVGKPGSGHRLILDEAKRTLLIQTLEPQFIDKLTASMI